MYYIRNRKCIVRLAKRNFDQKKIRNTIAILAMVLATVLFTTLFTAGIGAYESIQTAMQRQKGSKSDADLRYMTEEQFIKLSKDKRISMLGMRRPIGFLSNAKTHNIELDYMDAIEQELTFSVPVFGKAPIHENEIATTDRVLESLGIKPAVGAEIEVEFVLRGETYKYEMIVSGWWEASDTQISIMLVSDEFMKANKDIFPYTFDKDREYAGTYCSDVVFTEKTNMEKQLEEIILNFGGEPKNMESANYIASSVNEVTNPNIDLQIILILILFLALFIFVNYLLIFNIFEISVLQDIQRYGLLKTVGTTQRQIKFCVYIQTLWLMMIALPIGLLLGYILGNAILPVALDFMASEYHGLAVEISVNPLVFIGATIFTALTVVISIRKPISIAAKISPIEAMRYSDKHKKKNKRNAKKFSVWRLASANAKRNKKRCIYIIISMALCCILLNSTIIIANSVDIEKAVRKQCAVDILIANGNTFNNMKGYTKLTDHLDKAVIDVIRERFPVKDEGYLYKNTLDDANVTIDYGIETDGKELIERNGRYYALREGFSIPLGYDNYPVCNVYGCNDNVLKRCEVLSTANDVSIDNLYEKLKEGNYVIEAFHRDPDDMQVDMSRFQCGIGQKINVHTKDKGEREFEVIARIGLTPTEYEVPYITTGVAAVGGDGAMFFFSEDIFQELYGDSHLMSYSFNLDKEKLASATEELEEIVKQSEGEIRYSSIIMLKNGMNKIRNMIYIVGCFIGTAFGIAGIMNFINLMIANAITRKKEYAIMQSVGMTTKQLTNMVMCEGLYHALYSSVLGIGLALILGETAMRSICGAMWFMNFRLVLWPAAVLSFLTIVLSGVISIIIFKSFNRESIVEKIRKES
ncbi:MAG: ABC transporter permease [Lachnospiraceae bacterium]|nr:ABC transporter permease [Lachnospiraceae bacterium]